MKYNIVKAAILEAMKIFWRNFQRLLTTPSATNPEIWVKNLSLLWINHILSSGTFLSHLIEHISSFVNTRKSAHLV